MVGVHKETSKFNYEQTGYENRNDLEENLNNIAGCYIIFLYDKK